MYTLPLHRIALSAMFLAALAALVTGLAAAMGLPLGPGVGLAALALSALLFAGGAWLHDTVREARWNAGHRLR